jgi:hypothetical protein
MRWKMQSFLDVHAQIYLGCVGNAHASSKKISEVHLNTSSGVWHPGFPWFFQREEAGSRILSIRGGANIKIFRIIGIMRRGIE